MIDLLLFIVILICVVDNLMCIAIIINQSSNHANKLKEYSNKSNRYLFVQEKKIISSKYKSYNQRIKIKYFYFTLYYHTIILKLKSSKYVNTIYSMGEFIFKV